MKYQHCIENASVNYTISNSNTVHDFPIHTKKGLKCSNNPVYTRCYNASPGKLYMLTNLHTVSNNRVIM